MSMISVQDLSFCYEGSYDTIFDHVSFRLDTDWKLGFIGRNGRGKTTFLKLLMGEYEYSGHIGASVSFQYFPFAVADKDGTAEQAADALCPGIPPWRLRRELSEMEVEEDVLSRPFSMLSNGQQVKVLLSMLFLTENNFLLIDEPTNHLDLHGREVVSAYLKRKKGFILVSHDRAFLDGCVDHVLSINRANIEVQEGNFSSWWQNKAYQDAFELGENEKRKREIERLSKAARRTADWSDAVEKTKYHTQDVVDKGYIGHKSAKMMKRAQSIEARRQKAVEEKSKLLKNIETAESLKLRPLAHYREKLVEVSDLSLRYGEKTVVEGVSFSVSQGERIALQGKNGSGKTSILKLLMGSPIEHAGSVRLASGLSISYVSQDTSFLNGGLAAYARESGIDESLFKAILRKLDFSRIQFEKDMRSFSEGQKKKVLIAKSLCEQAHLYIWDEPLNFVDVLSRIQIERLILEYRPTLLFVEHDKAFIASVATGGVLL